MITEGSQYGLDMPGLAGEGFCQNPCGGRKLRIEAIGFRLSPGFPDTEAEGGNSDQGECEGAQQETETQSHGPRLLGIPVFGGEASP